VEHLPRNSESEPQSRRHTRIGHGLFLLYLALYSAFVLVNAFAPQLMELTPFGGVNLAVVSGIALIAVAFLLAVIYDWICRKADAGAAPAREPGR
jgi:uncharacterized membrane protein (DUF485 family)